MEYLDFWIPVAFGLYFIAPTLLIYATQTFRAEQSCEVLAPDQKVPRSVTNQLDSTRAELEALGFTSRGILVVSRMTENAAALAEFLVKPGTCDLAIFAIVYGHVNGTVGETVSYLEFIRRFRNCDYELLQTNNTGRPGAFIDEAEHLTFRFPSVKDIGELYELHQQLVDRHAAGCRPYLRIDEEFGGDPVSYFEAVTRECFERQTGRGWMKYNDRHNCWRPTLWGAFRMSTQELPPTKQLRTLQLHSRGRRMLRELQGY